MSGTVLIIESGAIETRAALVRGGCVRRLWFGPAMGREQADMRPLEGREFIGRVRRIDKNLNAAFVDIGARDDAFLKLKNTDALTEGAGVRVRVVARPRQSKGAIAKYLGATDKAAATGRINPSPAALEAVSALGADATGIVADRANIVAMLREHGASARMAAGEELPGLFTAYEADDALQGALKETVSLPGGGALHFAETEALAAIDVDTGSASASSSERLREKTIAEAAREAALQIERRNLGGRIVIDFPSIRSRAVRARAVKEIEKALSKISRVTSFSVAGSNFTTITREREGATLWDETTQIAPAEPVPGRQYTISWLARSALRAAERRQAAAPGARLCIRAGKALEAWLRESEYASAAYFERWGAHLDISYDDRVGDRDFEIVER